MSLRGLEIAIVEAILGVKRNFLMSVASIMTAALTLGVLGGFVLTALGMTNFVQSQIGEFEAAVWLKKDLPRTQIEKIKAALEGTPHISSVRFLSAEDAWKKIRHDLGDEIELGGTSPEQLSDHFVIKVDDLHNMAGAAKAAQAVHGVEEVIQAQNAVKSIVGFSDLIKWIGGGLALILLLISAFIVYNTIRLTVHSRRREIKIMQLVGATNWFIRLPLILEGTLLGTVGGGVACAILFGASTYLSTWVRNYLPSPLTSQFTSNVDPVWFYSSLVGLGWVIGAMGAIASIQKYLRA